MLNMQKRFNKRGLAIADPLLGWPQYKKPFVRFAHTSLKQKRKHRASSCFLFFVLSFSAVAERLFVLVGVRGFEPPASSSRTTRANRAALHPVAWQS